MLVKLLLGFCSILIFLILNATDTLAGNLANRLEEFPDWKTKASLEIVSSEDLIYPDWMEGKWLVKSTLVEQIAPLSPSILTPGFDSNLQYLDKIMEFTVKFVKKDIRKSNFNIPSLVSKNYVVADRVFNSLNITKAYGGEDYNVSVILDEDNPNRQITILPNGDQLISTITKRDSETLSKDNFITCELTQQFFRRNTPAYFNQVETISSYHLVNSAQITAEQITAIYLSPQDPDYFQAGDRPVALYRYSLELEKYDNN